MNEIIKELKMKGFNIEGLNSFQIKKIEDFYKVNLPEDYKYFLKSMGLNGGGFMRGEDCFYDRIFELRNYATELLEEDRSNFKLKPTHFIFYNHQGYIFAFFDTADNNTDSSIYYYFEGDLIPSKRHESFLAFFRERLDMIV